MSDLGEGLSPDPARLNRKADRAIRAFWDQEGDWRSLWSEVLEDCADHLLSAQQPELPQVERLGAMLWLIAGALLDAELGLAHPVLAIKARKGGGSPRSNMTQRARRRAIAVLAAHKLGQRTQGMTDVECFKEAAAHARDAGAAITWQQVRAAWQNTENHPSEDLLNIQGHYREARLNGATRGLAEIERLLAEAVAFYMKSPLSRERRGGPRKR